MANIKLQNKLIDVYNKVDNAGKIIAFNNLHCVNEQELIEKIKHRKNNIVDKVTKQLEDYLIKTDFSKELKRMDKDMINLVKVFL